MRRAEVEDGLAKPRSKLLACFLSEHSKQWEHPSLSTQDHSLSSKKTILTRLFADEWTTPYRRLLGETEREGQRSQSFSAWDSYGLMAL
jgi:hypothetical protein